MKKDPFFNIEKEKKKNARNKAEKHKIT